MSPTINLRFSLIFISISPSKPYNSTKIANEGEYEAFKSSQNLDADTSYVIEGDFNPTIFHDIAHFANFVVKTIDVNDGKNNYINLQPGQKFVTAYLVRGRIGAGQLVNLPINYEHYKLHVESLSLDDIDAIAQWPSTASIDLIVDLKPTQDIFNRITELQRTQNLKYSLSPAALYLEEYEDFISHKDASLF